MVARVLGGAEVFLGFVAASAVIAAAVAVAVVVGAGGSADALSGDITVDGCPLTPAQVHLSVESVTLDGAGATTTAPTSAPAARPVPRADVVTSRRPGSLTATTAVEPSPVSSTTVTVATVAAGRTTVAGTATTFSTVTTTSGRTTVTRTVPTTTTSARPTTRTSPITPITGAASPTLPSSPSPPSSPSSPSPPSADPSGPALGGPGSGRSLGAVVAPRSAMTAPPAAVEVTTQGDSLRFRVKGAKRGGIYRLSGAFDTTGCTALVEWNGPAGGIVPADGNPIHITGVTNGVLRVYAGAAAPITVDGAERDNWSDRDDVRSSSVDPAGTVRTFRWTSTAAGFGAGVWQVSLTPFASGCTAPAGLVASGTTTTLGSSKPGSFTVDFGALAKSLAKPAPGTPDVDVPGPQLGLPITPNGPVAGATPTVPSPATTAPLGSKQLGGGAPLPPPGPPQPIPFTGSFYVRVVPSVLTVPVSGGGNHKPRNGCGAAVTNPVEIRYDEGPILLGGGGSLAIYGDQYFAPATPDNPQLIKPFWDTVATFDWRSPGAKIHLVWSTSASAANLAQADHGEWQVSTQPFNPMSCADSPGLIHTGEVPLPAGAPALDLVNGPGSFDLSIDPSGLPTSTLLWIRVVPRTAGSSNVKSCAGPSTNTVLLKWKATASPGCPAGTEPPGCFPPPPPPSAPVNMTLLKYQPYHPAVEAPPICFIAVADHTLASNDPFAFGTDEVAYLAHLAGHGVDFHKGEHVCIWPPSSSSSWLDDLTSFVTDVVSFPAQVYELYKQVIPGIVGEILTQLNIANCEQGSSCYSVLYAAEEAGLAALGLPPSLPDAKALLDDGEDYLAEQISENSLVPKDVALAAIDAVKAKAAEQMAAASVAATGYSCADSWCIFDSGVRLPEAVIEVARPANDSSGLKPPTGVCIDAYPYARACAALPKNFGPGSSVKVAIRLAPELTGGDAGIAYGKAKGDCENPPSQLWQGSMPCDRYARDVAFGVWQNAEFATSHSTVLSIMASSALALPGDSHVEYTLDPQAVYGG